MAKKGGAVVIRTAAPAFDQEKKLRPVYDALESFNPKAALKLLVGFIGKYGRLPILLALQALSLQRMGKVDEALEIIRELLAQGPTDNTVMSPMTLVLQALNLPKEITLMYENALKKNPKNLEFMTQLFNAFGREHNFQRQQQIAMQLYTNSKELKFLFWSAVCWLLQIGAPESTVTPPASAQFLHLAYMMIMREAPKDTPLLSEQCRLVVRLLARQGKVKEAIDAVHGPYGKELFQDDIERRRLLVELHSKLENWTAVRDIYLDLLSGENAQPSDWHYLCEWIRTELRLVKAEARDESKIEEMLASLQTKELDKPPPQRGPFLASCELYFALEPSEKRTSKLVQSLIAYTDHFGTKSCWFDDVRGYLQALDSAGVQQICGKLQSLIKESAQPTTQCYLQINLQQVIVSFTEISQAKKEEIAKAMFEHYVSSLSCPTGSLEPTERGIGDVFLQLTCSILLELYKSSNDRRYLIDAVLALEDGLQRSRFNFQFKLLLVRLYSELGCMRRAIQIYESLSVKQVQLDSMTHVILHDAIRHGYWGDAHDLCSQVLQFHVQYGTEEQDMISRAFRANNFTKVLEFEELRWRLAHSAQAALCGAELRHLNLLQRRSSSVAPVCIDTTTLQCNQDYSVISSWHRDSQPFWDAVLNRPPPAVVATSLELPFDEPLTKTADAYGLGSYLKSYIELRGLIEKQLFAVTEKKIEVLQQSSEVLSLLEKMRLVDNSDSFRCRQWRLGLHCLETSRVLAETIAQNSGAEDGEANWEAVIAAFDELSRQITQVASLTLDSATITDVCMFLSYGGLWLTECLQTWAEQLPKKKGKKAKVSAATQVVTDKLSGVIELALSFYRNLHSQAEKLLTEPDLLPRDPFPAAKLAAEAEPEEKEKKTIEVPDIPFTHESLFAIPKKDVNLFFVRMKASNRGSFESISSVAISTIELLKTAHK